MTKHVRNKSMDKFSIISLKGDVLTLVAGEAHPPGYRMELMLEPPTSPLPVRISGKVISVKKTSPMSHLATISLRINSLQRSIREQILEHIARADGSSGSDPTG